ncbi:hydroxymethylglutaryl-CoA lyase [Neobacillus ginsengisoli]|uniref:Hydroxymethylglutaryl-CoA lyase n=1 Tax=Neobacillus ginsengisoli TaxID=904295 RepID=A0ABT9Y027_9BACI|nr:hydroxymethylglutaryl-CoA lyase [Neobacillus ginsengisoli]MDQ0201186.1 hydroxymethylglutaryl-CoA lyase [Neobacillus ginsengisoli]
MSTLSSMNLPSKVVICEVAPRDGFQAEKVWIPTEVKIAIIKKLAQTGIQSMEITSFVHPKAISQLKDAEDVVRQAQEFTGIKFRALVPNVRGAQRAIDAGIKKFKLMLSATDSHSISNANCLTEEAMNGFGPIIELADKHRVKVGGSISVAFGCPFEGIVPLERIDQIVERYISMGVAEISLADSTGMANPRQVYETVGYLKKHFPTMIFSMHLHNTRGLALANAFSALQQGITHFDSSIAGLGGCPYLPGASGNIASEDLVHAFHEMGMETGINLDLLINAAKEVKELIGHDGGSYMLQAGPFSLHEKPKCQEKLG